MHSAFFRWYTIVKVGVRFEEVTINDIKAIEGAKKVQNAELCLFYFVLKFFIFASNKKKYFVIQGVSSKSLFFIFLLIDFNVDVVLILGLLF